MGQTLIEAPGIVEPALSVALRFDKGGDGRRAAVSGVRTYSQNRTVAARARARADRKTVEHLS